MRPSPEGTRPSRGPALRSRASQRVGVLFAGILLAGLALATGCGRGAAPGGGPRQTATVSKRTIRSQIQATGIVRAMVGAEVKVGARISGKVVRLHANIGDRVTKGAPVAELEDGELRARLLRADADLAAAKAQLALLRRGARPEEVAEAEAAVSQAGAELALAEADTTRLTALVARDLVSREEAERGRRDLAVAESRVAAARSRLELVRQRYLPEEIALARAKVAQAEAGVMEARETLSYATVTAPIGGVVAQVTTQEGETVAAGMNAPTFVTIIDLDRLEVAAYVDEVDIGRVVLGQAATFTVDSFPDVEFTGAVTAIYPRAVIQANVVNYITTISIENSEGRLKPDMTANVVITLGERPDALVVPEKALRREGGRRVVAVVEGERTVLRPVRIGQRGGGLVEILDGLEEGDVVVLGGAEP